MEADKKDTSNGAVGNGPRENSKGLRNDRHKWIASLEYILEYILKNEESEQAIFLLEELIERLRESGSLTPSIPPISIRFLRKNSRPIPAIERSSDASKATCAGTLWRWL